MKILLAAEQSPLIRGQQLVRAPRPRVGRLRAGNHFVHTDLLAS